MKRFHVHMHVEDLPTSVAFYSRLFSVQPARQEADYAKWMLDDPRVNFAISTRGSKPGLDHFGFQADTAEELAAMKTQAQNADMAIDDEGLTSCCYANSAKRWVLDPNGVAWEHFHTLGNIPVFNEKPPVAMPQKIAGSACCAPASAKACC
jgi:catechol-2,3-dioxygenase